MLMGAPSSDTSQASTSPPTQNLANPNTNYFPPQPQGQQPIQQQSLPQYDSQLASYSQVPMGSSSYDDQNGPVPRLPRVNPFHQKPAQSHSQSQTYNVPQSQQPPPTTAPQYVTASMWQDALSRVTGHPAQKRRWFSSETSEAPTNVKRAR